MTSPSYKEVKVRNPLFDNIKAILITLVVFGHMLEYISITNEYAVIRAVLYSFHMPVFVFISGYFSNDQKDNYYKNTLIHCAVPYFIFNTVFAIIFSRKLIVDILTPRYLFWYLFSLLVWRVSVPLFRRIRFILPISIVLGLYCGVIHDADRFLSISRTISFMPYFIAGWMLANTKVLDHLQMIRKRFFTLTGIIMLVIVIFIQIYGLFPVKMYQNIECYECTGMSILNGLLGRAFSYCVGFFMIFFTLRVAPRKKYNWTSYGRTTLTTLIGSAFVGKACSLIIERTAFTVFLRSNICCGVAYSLIITIVIVFICGNSITNKAYEFIMKPIKKLIITDETTIHT